MFRLLPGVAVAGLTGFAVESQPVFDDKRGGSWL